MMLVFSSVVVTDGALSVFRSFNICCHLKFHTVLEHASIEVCVLSITDLKPRLLFMITLMNMRHIECLPAA